MNIPTSELKHLREEVKNCHRIIKDLQKKREFVGLTDEERQDIALEVPIDAVYITEAKLKERNHDR